MGYESDVSDAALREAGSNGCPHWCTRMALIPGVGCDAGASWRRCRSLCPGSPHAGNDRGKGRWARSSAPAVQHESRAVLGADRGTLAVVGGGENADHGGAGEQDADDGSEQVRLEGHDGDSVRNQKAAAVAGCGTASWRSPAFSPALTVRLSVTSARTRATVAAVTSQVNSEA